MKLSLIKFLTPVAIGLVLSSNVATPVSAQEVREGTRTIEEVKEGTIDKGTIDKGTIDKGTIDKGTIDKGTIEGKDVKDKSAETKEKSTKSKYVKDSGIKEPKLYELKDLPKSANQIILLVSICLTFIAVLFGTGQSIKYDRNKSKH